MIFCLETHIDLAFMRAQNMVVLSVPVAVKIRVTMATLTIRQPLGGRAYQNVVAQNILCEEYSKTSTLQWNRISQTLGYLSLKCSANVIDI